MEGTTSWDCKDSKEAEEIMTSQAIPEHSSVFRRKQECAPGQSDSRLRAGSEWPSLPYFANPENMLVLFFLRLCCSKAQPEKTFARLISYTIYVR